MTFTFSHDHVGITVTPEDLDTTIAWYSRNLGFTVDQRFESHGTTFVYLIAGDVKIELLAGAPSRGGAAGHNVLTSMDPSRLHHFCLAVPDLDAAGPELHERDVPLIGGPMEIPEIGQRIAFITDNVGTIIELAEPGTWPAGRNDTGMMPDRADFTRTWPPANPLAARRGDSRISVVLSRSSPPGTSPTSATPTSLQIASIYLPQDAANRQLVCASSPPSQDLTSSIPGTSCTSTAAPGVTRGSPPPRSSPAVALAFLALVRSGGGRYSVDTVIPLPTPD